MRRNVLKARNPLEGLKLEQHSLHDRYESLGEIGDGSFGTVNLAKQKSKGFSNTLVFINASPGIQC